jgi:uncharacterized protein (TIGR02118 family)
MSVQDFQKYWREDHLELVRKISDLKKYEQNHTLLSGYKRPVSPIFDGVEKMWFESEDKLVSIKASAAFKAAEADLESFVDMDRVKYILAREVVIKEGEVADGMVRMIEFLTRKPGMSPKDFHHHWKDIHGPLVAKQPQIKNYVQSHTLMSEYEKERQPDYNGVTEVWFDNTDAMREAAAAPLYGDVLADEKNFVPENTPFILSIDKEIRI